MNLLLSDLISLDGYYEVGCCRQRRQNVTSKDEAKALLQNRDIEGLGLVHHQLRIVPGRSEYLVEDFNGTWSLPTPEQLKEQTIDTLLHGLMETDEQTAQLVRVCDFGYEAVDDWDCDFAQLVGLVISAPQPAYEQLSNKQVWANLISIIISMICERIGSDRLSLKV